MSCSSCIIGFHPECETPAGNMCCCTPTDTVVIEATTSNRGGPTKAPEEMLDPTSTGRKQAVLVKPLEPGMICEWAQLKFAGGGVVPIIGCMGNEAKAVHHGPDKDTTNNDPDTNLHRICNSCHNRWHSLNDVYYGERPTAGTPFVPRMGTSHPHDKVTKAEPAEVYESELWWSSKKKDRSDYPNMPKELV